MAKKSQSKGKGKKSSKVGGPTVEVPVEETRESRDRIAGLYGHGTNLEERTITESPAEKSLDGSDNSLDADLLTTVESEKSPVEAVDQHTAGQSGERKFMDKTLTFSKLSSSGKFAIYEGLRTTLRVAITNFPDSKPADSFNVSGEFAGPREKKAPMTKEQRAEARKNRPKLTLAERIQKQRDKLAKDEAKLAAQAQAQPEPVGV